MFNNLLYRLVVSSIFFAAVTIFVGALLACQEDVKVDDEPLPEGVVLQKMETPNIISKSICTENLKAFTMLSNSSSALVVKSTDGLYYTKHIYKIYLLPNKTYTGTHSSKVFESATNSATEKTNVENLNGPWTEKDEQINLLALGKLRTVKRVAKDQKVEDVKESQIELVLNEFFGEKTQTTEEGRTTVLKIENASIGPKEQKVEDICQGL